MSTPRPILWVSSSLYVAVLLAGGYCAVAGIAEVQPLPFLGGIAAAAALDLVERRRYPVATPVVAVAVLLAARLGLLGMVVVADGSGVARVLFLLLPLTAYASFGLRVSLALGVALAGLLTAGVALGTPAGYDRARPVAELTVFAVGLALVVAVAEAGGRRLADPATGPVPAAGPDPAAERNRLARDLQAGIGHHLSTVTTLLERAAALRERHPALAARAIEDAQRSARLALAEARRAEGALRGEEPPLRLAAALADLVRDSGAGPVAVTLDSTGDPSGHDPAALRLLYRVAQEALANARRHSGAGAVTVSLRCQPDRLRLEVADDGRGFRPGAEGVGLRALREKLAAAGGRLQVETAPGRGTRLTATLPGPAAPAGRTAARSPTRSARA